MCRYFEIVECAKKLLLTVVIMFVEPGSSFQVMCTIILSFLAVLLYLILHPMESALAHCWKVILIDTLWHVGIVLDYLSPMVSLVSLCVYVLGSQEECVLCTVTCATPAVQAKYRVCFLTNSHTYMHAHVHK